MDEGDLTPLMILATSLAYVIAADGVVRAKEKEMMRGLLEKHVVSGKLKPEQFKKILKRALDLVATMKIDAFLEESVPMLTYAQKLSTLTHMYEALLADGSAQKGEVLVIRKFANTFKVTKEEMYALKDVVTLTSDTWLFFDPEHPYNDPEYRLNEPRLKKKHR